MVQNSGKTICAGTYKPVNTQEPVRVDEDASGRPVAVRTKRRYAVTAIANKWRLDDEWWRSEPVSRLYYEVMLASGQRMMLYKDIITGGWYRQSI